MLQCLYMARVDKRFQIACDQDVAVYLGMVIRSYGDAAFPPGGSECAQASREALHSIGGNIEDHAARDGALVSNRQRRLLRSAVNWYFGEVEISPRQQQVLLELLDSPRSKGF